MKKSKEETKKSFDKKSKKAPKTVETEERGVIYLGHIPHGFYEKEMRGYFTQFGNITRLRLSRSKKTGNSKHYAYIEFESADVARIVAETMNNYLLFEKMLKCVVIPPEQIHPKLFSGANKKYKHFNWSAHNRKMINKPKTAKELKAQQTQITKNHGKKQKALKKAGFDYELPKLVSYNK
ncbi:RNA-binding domain-containing protein [Backusella circina FSU 941]|nr:RNA-binding domain-containing protein [Backusella circina FSU 941]